MKSIEREIAIERGNRVMFSRRLASLRKGYGISTSLSNAEALVGLYRRVKNRTGLQSDYLKVCRSLEAQFSGDLLRTPAELKSVKRFAEVSKINLYPQTWIGNSCVDLFTPALGVRRPSFFKGHTLKGLVIEVDGSIHNTESKMKKDRFREIGLNELNMLVWRISNEEIYAKSLFKSRHEIHANFARLCSQERARIWGRVYLLTLLYHAPDEAIRKYFSKFKEVA